MAGPVDASARDEPLLLVGADVVTLDDAAPHARAVLIRRRRIAWVGDDPSGVAPPGCQVLDLTGTTLQPAFVNAHTHLTKLGLMLTALDLGVAESLEDCLAAVRANVDVTPGPVLWGIGWDETHWPEHRPPSADELSAAAGRPTMLSRSDGHCVVVDRTSLSAIPLGRARGVDRGPDGRPTGLLRQEAAQVAHRWFVAQLPGSSLRHARRLAARELASSGVASAHEMGGPHRMGPDDFDSWLSGEWPIEVIGYWGDLDLDFAVERGLRRVGGSLLLDGSIGSHSAALAEPYADKSGSGQLYRDSTELSEFALQATRKGIQVALHAIGDRAVCQAIEVFEYVAEAIGHEQLRRTFPRLEYAALVPHDAVSRLAALGVVVTVQAASDLDLGVRGGSYEQRLGPERARAANPLGALAQAGVPLAFGSDDIQALNPWTAVRSASALRHESSRMDPTDSLRAATLGGRIAARQPMVGPIKAGHRADLTAFEGTIAKPGPCIMTVVAGRIVHGVGLLSYA